MRLAEESVSTNDLFERCCQVNRPQLIESVDQDGEKVSTRYDGLICSFQVVGRAYIEIRKNILGRLGSAKVKL